MTFLYLLSWISVVIHVCFITLAIAALLYYLAELVEEYTVITGKVIKYFIFEFPISLIVCGLLSQITHIFILRTFPFFLLTSVPIITATVLLFINHYLAFSHFSAVYYAFSEVLAYFTMCLWLVPFALFVSLSANENVLPTIAETMPLLDDNDVVSNYFSRKSKRYGLLSLFNYAKESVLPERVKKAF